MRLFHIASYRLRYPRWLSALRCLWWRMLGMKIGKKTILGKIQASWPHAVELGGNCKIDDAVHFKVEGPYRPENRIQISDGVWIGAGCEFNIQQSVQIGEGTLIAAGCRFIDNNHGVQGDLPIRSQSNTSTPIQIGKNCWLGANVIVLEGVTLGDGVIVGAGAVVTKDVPPQTVVAGVPARILRSRNSNEIKQPRA